MCYFLFDWFCFPSITVYVVYMCLDSCYPVTLSNMCLVPKEILGLSKCFGKLAFFFRRAFLYIPVDYKSYLILFM